MDSRTRVSLALSHRQPDRIPIDYWATGEIEAALLQRYGFDSREQLLEHFDVDFRYIEGPRYIGPEPVTHPDGSVEDHWGVPRIRVEVGQAGRRGSYREVARFPLEEAGSLEEIRDWPQWPSPDWFDYECVRAQAAEARRAGKVVVFMGDRTNRCAQLKPAMYLRGIARILEDLALNPEIARYLFERIGQFYLEYARRTLAAADGNIDIFFTGDDFGTQTGLLISPAMWRAMLRGGFAAFIDLGHEFGCQVAHHTCGSIEPIIPDMIEAGLDILNPLQPDVAGMDHADLKARYGGRISFHGSISIQRALPFGTPEDVRNEVRDRAAALAPGGGFILCTAHNIQADTPLENVEALFDAYRQFGSYA